MSCSKTWIHIRIQTQIHDWHQSRNACHQLLAYLDEEGQPRPVCGELLVLQQHGARGGRHRGSHAQQVPSFPPQLRDGLVKVD